MRSLAIVHFFSEKIMAVIGLVVPIILVSYLQRGNMVRGPGFMKAALIGTKHTLKPKIFGTYIDELFCGFK